MPINQSSNMNNITHRSLILLTNYYPYYKGEEYLENEIEFASEQFDKVLIVATMASRTMLKTRAIPSNITAIKLDLNYSALGKIIQMVFGLTTGACNRKENKYNKNISLTQKAYELYYYSRVEYVYERMLDNSEVRAFLEAINPYTSLIYSYWGHVTASLGARLKDRYFDGNIAFISRGHRYDLYDKWAPCGFIPDRDYMLDKIDRFYACSEDGANYLRNVYPRFAGKISMARLGTLDHGTISCSDDVLFSMVSCSAVRSVKRLDKIIDLTRMLLDSGAEVRWTHIGDGPEFTRMRKYASKVLPSESYCFLGRKSNEEIFNWYRHNKVSLFLNLSDSEGIPVAIMEAMSCGIPVIATDVGGTREIIQYKSKKMIVSPSTSISEIRDLVLEIINMSSSDYSSLCQESRNIWFERFNAKSNYETFYNRMQTLLTGRQW